MVADEVANLRRLREILRDRRRKLVAKMVGGKKEPTNFAPLVELQEACDAVEWALEDEAAAAKKDEPRCAVSSHVTMERLLKRGAYKGRRGTIQASKAANRLPNLNRARKLFTRFDIGHRMKSTRDRVTVSPPESLTSTSNHRRNVAGCARRARRNSLAGFSIDIPLHAADNRIGEAAIIVSLVSGERTAPPNHCI